MQLQTADGRYCNSERLLTQSSAQRALNYWQRRLRLTEWTITVEIVRGDRLSRGGQRLLGECEVLSTKQIAVIRLLDHNDFIPDNGFVTFHDMELTLIHELLHVRLNGLRDGVEAVEELSEERAVHALSQTLSEFAARDGFE